MHVIGRPRKFNRRYPRVKCSFDGEMTTTQNTVHAIKVVNISLGGVALKSPITLPKGQRTLLSFKAVDHEAAMTIKVITEVAFVLFKNGYYELGMKYHSDIARYEAFIRHYVNERLKSTYS